MQQQLILIFSLLFVSTLSFGQEKDSLTQEEKERREKNIQAGNPFKKYGYTPKIATLSDGKYLEFHDLDSIVIIGSVYYNRITKKVVDFVERDMTNPDAQPLSDVRGRWLSPDPLSEEYSNWTPYNYVKNNPLRYSDPTGMAGEDFIDIKINTKDNTIGISITPAEGNDQVRLVKDGEVTDSYEYGENGSFNRENNIIDNPQTIQHDAEIGVQFGDFNKAETFFKFAAKSGVEFGMVDMMFTDNGISGFTSVLTNGGEGSVDVGNYARRILNKNSDAYVTFYSHSHPGNFNPITTWPAYPSGFDSNLKPTNSTRGDRTNFNLMKGKYGDRFPDQAEIYVPSAPGIKVKYDGEKVIRN